MEETKSDENKTTKSIFSKSNQFALIAILLVVTITLMGIILIKILL